MCGVIFSYSELDSLEAHIHTVEQALSRLRHRGPDENSIWYNKSSIVAHSRLSIIDLESSKQPFTSPCGRFILSYNGELYNYKYLRDSLSYQWEFRTGGDTEVLLAGLIVEGLSFLEKMEGMWAFSFWDDKEQELVLCRDRMGKKPLYYHNNNRRFIACSELPSLAIMNGRPFAEDLNSTADFFRYGYYFPGYSAYKNVFEVKAGHYLRWSPGKGISETQYWKIVPERKNADQVSASLKLQHTLTEAVGKRLIADVEVGAFLSGGIDSSLIVAIIRNRLDHPLKTFTLGFNDKSFDESGFAKSVADLFDTDHYQDKLDTWDPDYLKTLISDHVGQPFADPSILPTAMVSKLASSHVKVALSGDGGDELFCGYQRYQARSILRWYTRLPTFLRNNLEKLIKALPEPHSHHSRSIIKKAHLFMSTVDRVQSETPYIAPMFYSNMELKKLCPDIAHLGHSLAWNSEPAKLDDIELMMYQDALVYLPQDILLKVDRSSMANSLETRAPFLDHKLVELAFSFPIGLHRSTFNGKKLLKSTFNNILPSWVWKRRKQGFGVPLSNWFNSFLGNEFKELCDRHNTPISMEFASSLLNTHRSGKRDMNLRLWQLYTYLMWKDIQCAIKY